MSFTIDIKYRFTWFESNLQKNIEEFQNFISAIMEGQLNEQGETPVGEKSHKLQCHHGRNQERSIILRKKEKKLCSKNIIIHGVAEPSSVSKDERVKSGDVYKTNFTAALKVRFTIKRESKKAVLIPK